MAHHRTDSKILLAISIGLLLSIAYNLVALVLLSVAGQGASRIAPVLFPGGFISDLFFDLPMLSVFAGHMTFFPVNILLFFFVFSLLIWKIQGPSTSNRASSAGKQTLR
jgi:hypothetical protein